MDVNVDDHGVNFGERSEDEESYGSVRGDGFDTRRSFSQDDSSLTDFECFNDEGLCLPTEETNPAKHLADSKSLGSAGSGSLIESPQIKTSEQYQSIPFGLIHRAIYEHGKRSTDIMGVTYNARMRQFMIIDSKGVTGWKRDAVDHRVSRALHYPKYEYGLITNMIYAKKYNCYFVLGKDFSLKVYNRDFYETCSVSADLRSVLFMLFNPVRDELITGGVGGTKVWRFHQQSEKSYTELKPLANYGLTLKYELPNVGGSWVKRVELDYHLEHLYCCSDTDLHVYDLAGKLLFKFERAHMMSITGCRYSRNASVLVTSSIDCEVKVWSLMGGLVHTFRGHSRAVTNLILHPFTSSIVITCSLDGTVRMWSLDTMDTLYSLIVSTDGVMWMGLTDDNLLFLSTQRAITLWNLNYSLQFWAMARSKVTKMSLVGCKGKTTRLMALTEDSSVRLMARSTKKNLCTVLPPPSISPLQRVLSVCYSREFNVIFMLINPHEVWVYTTRTDPSCRIAVWDVIGVQAMMSTRGSGRGNQETFGPSSSISVNKPAPTHRATENGAGNEALANCCCVTILNSTAILWTEEGPCCPIRDSYLLMGLEDGRILFMDPVIKGHKYLEFKSGKDPVLDMTHDMAYGCLTTVHKLKDMMQILVWSLPDLELQHEVYASSDLRAYARVGYTLVTGHESGCVIFNTLEITNDPGLNKGRMPPLYEEVIDVHHKPEHLAPVIGVDVCAHQKMFCSCSNDGAIKIWNEDGVLMTEIMLDPSLASVCFLNNMGDLLVGFQKQIFYIDHTKVCPHLTVPDSDVDGFEKESFICEDPAVLYEGVTPNPDPITLESYLVPYDIEFSKDFLEGRVKLEPDSVKEEESDEESEVSMAPTDVYLSPVSTPRSQLSQIDLTLGVEVSKYDLLKQMKKTLSHLAEKERMEAADMVHQYALDKTHRKVQARKRRKMIKHGLLNVEDFEDGVISSVEEANIEDKKSDEEAVPTFEFPKFGESPGPTPESSRPPTPQPLSESEDETDIETIVESTPMALKIEVVVKEPDEISKFLEAAKSTDYSKLPKSPKPDAAATPRKKFGLSSFSIDAESLMKEKKKVVKSTALDTSRSTLPPTPKAMEPVMESPRKEKAMKKRKSLTGRKLPKSKKADVKEDKARPGSPPSTQMQALELKEQKLAVPQKKVQHHMDDQTNQFDKSRETLSDTGETQDTKQTSQKENDQTIDPVNVTIPGLPSVPIDVRQTEADRVVRSAPSSGLKATSMDTKSSIDFSSVSRAGTLSREMTMTSHQDDNETAGGRSEPITVDSGIHMDRLSMLSGGSEEGQAAFRIALISKEINGDGSPTNATPSLLNTVISETKLGGVEPKKDDTKRECHQLSVNEPKKDDKVNEPKTDDKVNEPKKDPKGRECHQLSIDSSNPNKLSKPNKQTLKPKANAPTKPKKILFTKERQKLSGGKKLEPKVLGSLLEVEDVLEQPASQGLTENEILRSASPAPTTKDKTDITSLLAGLPMTKHISQSEMERSSPDSSSHRVVTPTLSIIDTESISSSTNLAPSGFVRAMSSPVPLLTEGPPLHSSPLPTVEEVSIKSWPFSIQSETSQPATSQSINIQSSTLSSKVIKDHESKISGVDSNSKPLSETVFPPSDVKDGTGQKKDILKSNSPQILNKSRESSQNDNMARETIDETKINVNNKEHSKENGLSDVVKTSPDLNARIESDLSLSEGRSNLNILSESQDNLSLKGSAKSLVLKETSFDTLSPLCQILIHKKGEVNVENPDLIYAEESINQADVVGNDESKDVTPEINFGEELECWDSDFDNMSASDGSFILSSAFSDTTNGKSNNSSSSSQRKSIRQSLQNLAGNASSSSATEPVLQVKIRKKPWSYYRNKEQNQSPLPLRKEGQRKFSQNDALTVQRNAYLDSVKLRKKRARSAVEGTMPHHQTFQRRQFSQQQQQQQLSVTSSSTATTPCMLCAAEEDKTNDHTVEEHNNNDISEIVTERKVNFEDDGDADLVREPVVTVIRDGTAVPEPSPRTSIVEVPEHPTAVDVWGKGTPSTFDTADVRPNSQALSQVFSDVSSIQPVTSPDLNQSISLTDFSHLQSHEDAERRPGSVESGWMGSDLISVSRMEDQRSREGKATADMPDGAVDQANQGDVVEESEVGSLSKQRRPVTCLTERTLGKPELDNAVKCFRQRPHTAQVRFQTADLQEAYDNSLERYKVMARTPLASDKIHRNDDMAFSENWHERQIERHMLIRMQKELRAQSAIQRRQILDQVKQERFKQHQEEDHGFQYSKFHPYLYGHAYNAPQRSNTVHGSRPSQTGPTTTPVSSRPHTSTGTREQRMHPKHIHISPHQHNHHENRQQPVQQDTETLQLQKDRTELSQEKSFRFRLREKDVIENDDQANADKNNIDLWMIDPRNPNAVRPKSRKSIPSRCHRYVLVTKPKIKLTLPLPTPLEEELLASRFPEQGEKVYKKYEGLLYKPPRRPVYGIEYTPFNTFQTYTT